MKGDNPDQQRNLDNPFIKGKELQGKWWDDTSKLLGTSMGSLIY